MTTTQLVTELKLSVLSQGQETEIHGGFCGDLLSWVMANARENNVWFTVMGNINAVAVASLNDVSCMVLCQGSSLNADALDKAIEEGINIFSTNMSIFEAAGKFYMIK